MLQVTFKKIVMIKKKKFGINRKKDYQVHLQDTSGNILPIYITEDQASAIICGNLVDTKPKRPLTHDLFANVLTNWSLNLEKVIISDLDKDIYFASLVIKQGDTTKEIDCRPSDAIALAVRVNCPIFVSEALMLDKSIAA